MGYNLHWAAEQKYTTRSSINQIRHVNNLIAGLKTDGDWQLMDAFWVFALETNDQALINFINPGTYSVTLVNSPTFTAKQGYNGNGASSYLNTNFNLSTNGVNYVQNSASVGIYGRTQSVAQMNALGAAAGEGQGWQGMALTEAFTDGRTYGGINDADTTASSAINATSRGFWHLKRTGANAYSVNRNGSALYNSVKTSAAPLNKSVHVGRSNATVNQYYSNRQYSICIIGGALSVVNLNTRVEAYMDAIGAGVQ